MLETALAQLRFAGSILFGTPFSRRALDHLIDGLLAHQQEFGVEDCRNSELLSGPALDGQTRRAMHLRRFRTQAARAARETPHYHTLFAQLAVDPMRLRYEDIARIPPTPKEALRNTPDSFVRRTARPCLRTTTTGTTGRPTSIAFSAYEMQTYVALEAIGMLVNRQIAPDDVVLISSSSRASLGNTCFAGACARIGALVCPSGLVDPEITLGLLAELHHVPGKKPRVSYLLTYPSYLGELIEVGRRLGYRPADFGLERIGVGGEIVSAGLKERCLELFGSVPFVEGFGMTEIWPVSGVLCSQGHLHFEASQGLLEVVDSETGSPSRPGEVGTLVVTPLPPYRDTTLVLRYDTEDLVRVLPEPLTCSLRHVPAVSQLLGKRRLAVHQTPDWVCVREIAEALEAVRAVPLPARYGFWAVPGGVAVEVVLPQENTDALRQIARELEARGVPLQALYLRHDWSQLCHPIPLRSDLRETSFPAPSMPVSSVA
jgi:phenylacetate-coenzyme A ligase PaaK-like adenylate-forming protein